MSLHLSQIQSIDKTNYHCTKNMKFSIKDFVSRCGQIRRKLRIWSHLLTKSLMGNFIFCAVYISHKKNFRGNTTQEDHSFSEISRTCAYQGVTNVSFSEKLAYVLNERSPMHCFFSKDLGGGSQHFLKSECFPRKPIGFEGTEMWCRFT